MWRYQVFARKLTWYLVHQLYLVHHLVHWCLYNKSYRSYIEKKLNFPLMTKILVSIKERRGGWKDILRALWQSWSASTSLKILKCNSFKLYQIGEGLFHLYYLPAGVFVFFFKKIKTIFRHSIYCPWWNICKMWSLFWLLFSWNQSVFIKNVHWYQQKVMEWTL